MAHWLPILLPSLALASLQAQAPLTVQEAIRQSWTGQSGLQAGAALVDRAQADSAALRALRLPTLTLSAGLTRSDEPMQAFGTRLDQARIGAQDFLPASLNHPEALTGTGASLTLAQPLYAGGKLDAARRAGEALASSEAALQAHRQQQVALAVAQAYFSAQGAESALRFAEDSLRQAQETERFVQARVGQGLMLASEGERTRAFRAQAQAGLAEARQRVASARSTLALLMGAEGELGPLATPLATPLDIPQAIPRATPLPTPLDTLQATPLPPAAAPGLRADLEAARLQGQAAQAGVAAALGSLKPEVGLNLTAGTARYALNAGGTWTTASVGAKWTFSFAGAPRVHAARASARAAELGLQWQTAQARREVREARASLDTAQARIAFAQVAVAASESVRAMRLARHREGLLPLMDVLDAESGLSAARTLLLNSQLDFRLGQAQLALALGQPIEGVKE